MAGRPASLTFSSHSAATKLPESDAAMLSAILCSLAWSTGSMPSAIRRRASRRPASRLPGNMTVVHPPVFRPGQTVCNRWLGLRVRECCNCKPRLSGTSGHCDGPFAGKLCRRSIKNPIKWLMCRATLRSNRWEGISQKSAEKRQLTLRFRTSCERPWRVEGIELYQ